jgi:four helix bundle protein
MKNFRHLKIWKLGLGLVSELDKRTDDYPKKEGNAILSQIRRAATSVPSNIAEGSSNREKLSFMEISMGSLNELETLLFLSQRLEYPKEEDFHKCMCLLSEEQKMLTSFMQKLKANS